MKTDYDYDSFLQGLRALTVLSALCAERAWRMTYASCVEPIAASHQPRP